MDTVLLISNEVLHYRQKIYNHFYERFRKDGLDFHVLSNSFQKANYELKFAAHELPFSVRAYLGKIRQLKPKYVIVFLHLKDIVLFPILYYCKMHHIPVVYWGIGVNSRVPNAKFRNMFFHHAHNICDALITYTPATRNYYQQKNWKKLFVACNTLDFSEIDPKLLPDKATIRAKYGIYQKYVILFISRMMPYKRVDLLMDLFEDEEDIAVVMVGPGFSPEQQKRVDAHDNLYYLGEKYGTDVHEIYKMGDVFSTPGHIGLANNEAIFWGLPVVLLDGFHGPEIDYMKNGITGYLAKDEAEFKTYMLALLHDEERRSEMSHACRSVYEKELNVDRMYQGFIEAIHYCSAKF